MSGNWTGHEGFRGSKKGESTVGWGSLWARWASWKRKQGLSWRERTGRGGWEQGGWREAKQPQGGHPQAECLFLRPFWNKLFKSNFSAIHWLVFLLHGTVGRWFWATASTKAMSSEALLWKDLLFSPSSATLCSAISGTFLTILRYNFLISSTDTLISVFQVVENINVFKVPNTVPGI